MPIVWLDTTEAAAMMECTEANVAKLCKLNKLVHFESPRGGGQIRYMVDLESIKKYIEKREIERPNWRNQGKRKRG